MPRAFNDIEYTAYRVVLLQDAVRLMRDIEGLKTSAISAGIDVLVVSDAMKEQCYKLVELLSMTKDRRA